MCIVAYILGGAEEHEEQSGGAGVVRDSAEALPEVEGKAMAECGIHDEWCMYSVSCTCTGPDSES